MNAGDPEILSFDAARSALEAPGVHERFAAVLGRPLLVVECDEDAVIRDGERARVFRDRIASLPCVTVARLADDTSPARVGAGVLDGFDVVVTCRDELDALRRTVFAAPLAALVFVQLLRGSLGRGIEEGLVAESMAYSALQSGPEFAAWRAGHPPRSGASDEGAPVRSWLEGETLFIELDRPHRHNAFSRAMRDALCDALELAAIDRSVERVRWSGRGPSFCSGGDLDEFGTFPDPVTAHAVRTTRSPARAVVEIAGRLEARVHGACMGAGIELPAFAARVVAAPDARFALPELSLGLVPGAGGTVSLPRRIGRQATARLALTGEAMDAQAALAVGLIDGIEGIDGAEASGSPGLVA